MADEKYTFEQARIRLEEIASLARKKDTSLEKSLDLLEEGVRLANICTELVDHTDMSATATADVAPSGTSNSTKPDADVPLDGSAPGSVDDGAAAVKPADEERS